MIAEAFISDLASVLSSPSRSGRVKPHGHQGSGLASPSQLFLFIDDYEAYQDTFGEKILLREMMGRLQTAPFKSTILVSGRDSLGKSHPDWKRNFPLLQDTTMSLKPLREDDIHELLSRIQIDEDVQAIARTMYQETEGYPLLIDYALEELSEGELSALSLKAFFDRQAQWMTQRQRMWLERICFADVVNHESIHRLLPDEDPSEVFDWFKSEASIRDTSGSEFRVRPFVRARILRFVQISDPAAYETMSRHARMPSAGA